MRFFMFLGAVLATGLAMDSDHAYAQRAMAGPVLRPVADDQPTQPGPAATPSATPARPSAPQPALPAGQPQQPPRH